MIILDLSPCILLMCQTFTLLSKNQRLPSFVQLYCLIEYADIVNGIMPQVLDQVKVPR